MTKECRLRRKAATSDEMNRVACVVDVEHYARILKNFASIRFYFATLRADVASMQQFAVASYD